jgi:hypothetical protein
MIFFDTETCGLCGPCVLIQWSEGFGEVHLHSVWKTPIIDTLKLIEKFCNDPDGVVGFNLEFDWFQLAKLYTMLSLYPDYDAFPEDIIEELAYLEPKARDGLCIKPVSACDVMAVARKGPYQSTMDRGDIRIRRVPTALAWQLAQQLERQVPLSDILFARRKEKGLPKWQVYDIHDDDDEIIPDFKDIVLKFAPSSALKALAVDALKLKDEDVLRFVDVEIDSKIYPTEIGYAPYALAVGNKENWNGAWPDKIKHHISHWAYFEIARKYAKDDVLYTRDLWKHFGSPTLGDDDSILACMVGAVRWKGFACDVDGLRDLREKTLAAKTKILPDGKTFEIPTSPEKARWYVQELMDETEILGAAKSDGLDVSTKKVVLQTVAKYTKDCPHCLGEGTIVPLDDFLDAQQCVLCNGKGHVIHPAALRATEVLEARQSRYEADLYDKFILAGRFHASFRVIGTLSSRMSGGDGLNAQGVKKTKEVRGKFPLAFPGYVLCGGDFAGFEVTLAEACYKDPDLRKDLQSGKKIHALFGVHVFPDMTYEEILKTEGTKDDRYTRCKQAVFAMFYGGEGFTLKDRLGVDIETADKAYQAFCARYKNVGFERKKVFSMFCSMRQPGGLGSKVEWHEPADYIESMFGFRRYFTLENSICRALFELANKPPKDWKEIKIRVQRRDRMQTAMGAVQSALYAAAFGLQAGNMRAAANHVIQSAGAQVTKKVQRNIWDIQPPGVNKWIVQPMNIHDEIMCPVLPGWEPKVKEVVDKVVESIRPKVPLIKMEWVTGLKSWAEKG